MGRKQVLFLAGSRGDMINGGEPTQIGKIYLDEKKNSRFGMHLEFCSADRAGFNIKPVISEREYDGIIYMGGKALVLGSAINNALGDMRRERSVNDYRRQYAGFLDSGNLKRPFEPRGSEIISVPVHYITRRYIPAIGVPLSDPESRGLAAFTAITESPPGCDPRSAVGVGRLDSAICVMEKMLSRMDRSQNGGFERALVVYDENYECEAGANKIKGMLDDFGVNNEKMDSNMIERPGKRGYEPGEREMVIFVDGPINKFELQNLDERTKSFVIHCRRGGDMSGWWMDYLAEMDVLNNTVSVGVGAYENAALLAARLYNMPEVDANAFGYMNEKAKKSFTGEMPEWLRD